MLSRKATLVVIAASALLLTVGILSLQSNVIFRAWAFEAKGVTLAGAVAPAQPGDVSAASDPELPRDFSFSLPLFASNSAWNQTATNAQVLSTSDQQILTTYRVLLGDFDDLVGYSGPATTWPYLDINFDDYSVPIFRAGTGQQDVLICADDEGNKGWPHPKFGIPQLGGPVSVPAPAGQVRPAGPQGSDADGHLVIYDRNTFIAYDYYFGTTQRDGECLSRGGGYTGNRILEAGVVDFFDVRGDGANAATYYSARALGTPLLAGMILPEDVKSGAIDHALAFAIPGPRNRSSNPTEPSSSEYFYPASTTETDFYSTNPYALIAGQRIRLKSSIVDEDDNLVDESQLAPITQMFLAALRTHGAYLVENAGGFSFYAEDIHTANLNLTNDEVNALIGQPAGTPLPAGMTQWQAVLEQIYTDLELVPFASGPWTNYDDPTTAVIFTANYVVVEPATKPGTTTISVYLPLVLRNQ